MHVLWDAPQARQHVADWDFFPECHPIGLASSRLPVSGTLETYYNPLVTLGRMVGLVSIRQPACCLKLPLHWM